MPHAPKSPDTRPADAAAPPHAKPALTPKAEADLAARRKREAEALRANLRRRKQQPPAS